MGLLDKLSAWLEAASASSPELSGGFFTLCDTVIRYLLPLLALILLSRCVRSLLRERADPEVWAWLVTPSGDRRPLRHWENTVGRARSSDVVVAYPTISRSHAALIRDDSGGWTVYDLGSTGGVLINGEEAPQGGALADGDVLALGGVELSFITLSAREERELAKSRAKPGRLVSPGFTFALLSLFQALLCLQLTIASEKEYVLPITLAFAAVIVAQWCYYLIMRSIRRVGFEVETIAFFLSSLGLCVAASSTPGSMLKQVLLLLMGVVLFVLLGWWLRDLDRAKKLRWPAAVAAAALLVVNYVFSEAIFGAQNWLIIGGFSIQPSEFVKIAFIYAGAATLDRLFMGRNLWLFIAFSAFCVGALALMGDFGTALIFFAAFLVISFLRSGNLATIALAVTGAGLAGFLVLSVKPYIARRFETWGHVWEYANEGGYQQTRALSAAASGGLFGQGAGRSWLVGVVAADTDLVFCVTCEQLGLIIAVCAVLAILVLAAFVVKSAGGGRSSFYVIASTAAVSMLMVQLALNVFGSVDILPLTGVTFPFLSRGGSSLVSCWALMAFVKAADTRQNASFTTRLPSRFDAYEPWEEKEPVDGAAPDGESGVEP